MTTQARYSMEYSMDDDDFITTHGCSRVDYIDFMETEYERCIQCNILLSQAKHIINILDALRQKQKCRCPKYIVEIYEFKRRPAENLPF